MRALTRILFAAALAGALASPTLALAQWGGRGWHDHGWHDHGWGGPGWGGGPGPGGFWHHGWHDGRMGWWWILNGGWTYYPAPVYGYPPTVYAPPPVMVAPAPVQQYYYYCQNPAGYYPTVPQCTQPWQAVPVPAGR